MVWPLGVTVDLDDTLFPQSEWLAGAWSAVAVAGGWHGLPVEQLRATLLTIAAEGSDRGAIIDRAVAGVGGSPDLVPDLVEAFGRHAPPQLDLFPGVAAALGALRSAGRQVVVVTDGKPAVQYAKIDALGVRDLVHGIVVTDGLGGRTVRKPHPAGFEAALALLGLEAGETVHVGDRPDKDCAGALGVGMRCIRVTTGEYATVEDPTHPAWRTVPTFTAAVELLLA